MAAPPAAVAITQHVKTSVDRLRNMSLRRGLSQALQSNQESVVAHDNMQSGAAASPSVRLSDAEQQAKHEAQRTNAQGSMSNGAQAEQCDRAPAHVRDKPQAVQRTRRQPQHNVANTEPAQSHPQAEHHSNEAKGFDDVPVSAQLGSIDFEAMIEAQLAEENASGAGDMRRCPTCSRSFKPEALQKHANVCKKVFVQKRKAFDITSARAAEGAAELQPGKPALTRQRSRTAAGAGANRVVQHENRPAMSSSTKQGSWKQKSEMLRAAMRANRCAYVDACLPPACVQHA